MVEHFFLKTVKMTSFAKLACRQIMKGVILIRILNLQQFTKSIDHVTLCLPKT